MEHKIYRSRTEKTLFGVCGGLAKHFDVDPTLIRLGVALLGLCWGAGILLYLVAACIIPNEPIETEE